ncbi:tetratricopeptide repeat protein [Actinoplanes aureus]|uniref:Tetratricopeptide repeat protein n=1 Tax=Actinoplanes aureus TaxID=2792083 RepID=A0A931CPE9_9ACTN|nr:hypothetical protein [Actinoplanes aureus]MBG0568645.1 hypothetical protein [Actinoplanes aureus]
MLMRPDKPLAAPYNIVVAPPAIDLADAGDIGLRRARRLAERIHTSLHRRIIAAFENDPLAEVGSPCQSDIAELTAGRSDVLDQVRKAKDGDVAVSFVLSPRVHRTTVRLEVSIGGSRLGEAAELSGYQAFDELDIGDFSQAGADRDLLTSAAEQADAYVRILHAVAQYTARQYDTAASTLTPLQHQHLERLTRRLVLVMLGNIKGRLGRDSTYKEARRYYEDALVVDPTYARARLGLAEVNYQAGARSCGNFQPAHLRHLDRALGIYKAVLTGPAEPDVPDVQARAHYGMGRIGVCRLLAGEDKRERAEAIKHLRFVINRYEHGGDPPWLRTPTSEAYGHLAIIYGYVMNDVPHGLACYHQAGETALSERRQTFADLAADLRQRDPEQPLTGDSTTC